MAVPVAEAQFSVNWAASACWLRYSGAPMRVESTRDVTTGKSRKTKRWSSGTSHAGERMALTLGRWPARYAARPAGPPFRKALLGARPQMITATLRKSQGIQAFSTFVWLAGASAGAVLAPRPFGTP